MEVYVSKVTSENPQYEFYNNNGEKIEHIAPCYTISKPGSQRIILALEDSIFVNVHKNPTNTQDIPELEKEIVSMTIEEYNIKYKNI